ncbi:uncharacterized protein LOC144344669 [Saccoglossus kowalevskii]
MLWNVLQLTLLMPKRSSMLLAGYWLGQLLKHIWKNTMLRRVAASRQTVTNSTIIAQGPLDIHLNDDTLSLSSSTKLFDDTSQNDMSYGEHKGKVVNDGQICQLNIVGIDPINSMHVGPDAHTVVNTPNGFIAQINIYRDVPIKEDRFTVCVTEGTHFAIGSDKATVTNHGTVMKIDIYGAELNSMHGLTNYVLFRNRNESSPVIRIKCWNRVEGRTIKINGGDINLPVSKTEKISGCVTEASHVLKMTMIAFPEKKIEVEESWPE